MPDVPIIGQPKTPTPDPETLAWAREQAAKEESEGISVATAFVITISHEGSVDAHTDLSRTFVPSRPANSDDIVGALAVVQSDLQTAKTSNATAMAIMQAGQAMQQQMAMRQQQQQIQANLGNLRA